MGLVEDKTKLRQLNIQLSQKEKTLAQLRKDCAYCKLHNQIGDVSPDGMKCFNTRDNECKTTQNGGIALLIRGISQLKLEIDKQEIKVAAEEIKNDVYLKEQEILQETFYTDKTEQQVAQELAKAQQELEKLKLQSSKASAASRLADKGDMESARALLGVQEAEGSWKKPVMIGGIVLLAIGVGFGIWWKLKGKK